MSTTTPNLGLHKYTVSEVGDTVGDMVTGINADADTLDGLLGLVYPVGSIYMSVNSTSPATLFGGTWEALGDKFLIGAGTNHAAGATGGSETKTISTANLPSHTHGLNSHKHTIGAHSHGLNSHKHSIGAHSHGLNSHTHSVGAHKHGLGGHKHTITHTHDLMDHTHSASLSTGYSLLKTNVSTGSGSYSVLASSGAQLQASGRTSEPSPNYTGPSSATYTGTATGDTDNSSAFNTGAASGSTANSTAFDSGAASGSTANSTAFDSGAASGNTAATGSGDALNIMPPFLSVYMWKRTA